MTFLLTSVVFLAGAVVGYVVDHLVTDGRQADERMSGD